ncbi:NADH dehydrogenase subunit M [Desulfobulbus propionicus DSM 2032]|uniref:NADH dehydrogenase subunit M n=1 Tax=Desulfobulbus propionicus (strain ATCC 33891 / DSM 2032 / VKM B-1956 / 1pr3) TaxID=577650 RepID=A0A7U3YMB4_DESPD|nr:NADH-quinone oxidoreductase subunit M [Desulfobulbus propionicus]ADW18018.1 NADH dehydrogenase subunit M [Desulfobulbus propionicus DSM 2032]
MSIPLLSTLIFFPVLGGLSLLIVPRQQTATIRLMALFVSLVELLLTLPVVLLFDKTTARMQFTELHPWISTLNINYSLGIDGISILFLLLTALITLLSVLVSWEAIHDKVQEFFVALLLLEGAMMGVFCALDFFLFYIFWEAMLIPMFLIIGIWGGPNRIYATVKFFLYTLVGSLLMLVGIILLYQNGGHTFDILKLAGQNYSLKLQLILFWAFFAAFAVKVPMWPVHTWLPDAHTEAPAAGSVILAGVLIKMGAYGFLRFSLPILPEATQQMLVPMLVLSVIAIVYGAIICLAQTDLKRLIAYSSVSHMGFVTLGLFALNQRGLEGAILQMINHGVVTGALFLAIGMIYERTHTREISAYGGLATTMPVFAGFFLLFTLAAVGLPGTNGFIGEFLILLGGFERAPWAAVVAASGLILGAWYMLWLYQRIFFNEVSTSLHGLTQLNLREILTLTPMVVLIFWIGLYPNALLGFLHVSVGHLLDQVNGVGLAGPVLPPVNLP